VKADSAPGRRGQPQGGGINVRVSLDEVDYPAAA
jgi:hypothetical protein